MTVNAAGRGRRRAPAAAENDPGPVTPTRRRGGRGQQSSAASADAPVLLPVGATALASGAVMPMASGRRAAAAEESNPSAVPDEAPAVLYPADRRGPNRPFVAPHRQPLAIGEIGQTLFDCPACRRPLALGAHRCPGCGIRLIRGVSLGKAASFVAVGVLVGLLGGAGGRLAFGGGLGAAGGVAAVIAASPGPTAAPASTGTSSPRATDSPPAATPAPTLGVAMPPATAAAMALAIAESDRLAAAEADLRAALASKPFDSSAVAQTMRSISAEAVYGEQIAGSVASWSGSSEVGADLRAFYSAVHGTAADALDNSVRNATAYRAAARTMADLLAGRAPIDAEMRAIATAAGVSLPEPSPAQ